MPSAYGSLLEPAAEEEGRAQLSSELPLRPREHVVMKSDARAKWKTTAWKSIVVVGAGCLLVMTALSQLPSTGYGDATAISGLQVANSITAGASTKINLQNGLSSARTRSKTKTKLVFLTHWGLVNPETGMMRASCEDTVSQGSFGSQAPADVHRFNGEVGDRFTVECPPGCAVAEARIYGCELGPFMDETSICKAAVASQLIGDNTGGIVTFELVEPIASYKACSQNGLNDLDEPAAGHNIFPMETNKWIWYKWRWAERPANIQKRCSADWISANPGVPCAAVVKRYRSDCKVTNGAENCFGLFAFKFIEPCPLPVITPEEGVFDESAQITVTPSEPDPSVFIVCTTNGKAPDASSPGKMPPVPPDGIINLSPGNYTIQCQAANSHQGPSRFARAKIDVLPRLPLPDIDPDTGSTFVEEVTVSIDPVEAGAAIFYTTDGTDPTLNSDKYVQPFEVNTIGSNTIKAMSHKVEWADSFIATSEIRLLERLPNPTFEPYMGAFTNAVVVHLKCEREGAKIHYTTDGTEPSGASSEYSEADGVKLGLNADGNEADYIIKAIAVLPPDLGDSFVATSGRIIVMPPVSPPEFTPNSEGPFKDKVQITMASATEQAIIRYTIDGSEPSLGSQMYMAPVELTHTGVIVKAKGFHEHYMPSTVSESVAYKLEVSDPTMSPNGGEFVDSVLVTIASDTPAARIHYTLDGTDPDATCPVYNRPLAIGTTGVVIKAVALHSGLESSNIVESATFTVKASAPELDPADGVFTNEALIKATTFTGGAEIRCTSDGSEPTPETPTNTDPLSRVTSLTVTNTGAMVRCVATKTGLTVSDVTSMASPIVIKAIPPVMTPDSGSFTNEVSIVMSCASEDCKMHYTTDGSTPTEMSTLYTEPVVVRTTGTVVQAISVADGKTPSDIKATSAFSLYASAPTFSSQGIPWEGHGKSGENFYVEKANITMESSTPDAGILYTVDGSIPDLKDGIHYNGWYEDTTYGTQTLKAIAYAAGKINSPVATSTVYDIVYKSPIPSFLPASEGPFTKQVEVSIESSVMTGGEVIQDPDVKIYFTTDGSNPSRYSRVYGYKPILINWIGTTELRAILTKKGQADSEVATQSFRVLPQVDAPDLSPQSGVFPEKVTIEMSSKTKGATFRYTTDGTMPNAASPECKKENEQCKIILELGPDGIQTCYVVKVIASKPPGMGDSVVVTSGEICVQPIVATPIISPDEPGPYQDTLQVSLIDPSPAGGSVIRYTTNGADPTEQSSIYLSPITLTTTGKMVKAKAFVNKMWPSVIADSPTFELSASDPTISPNGGVYVNYVMITLASATPGAKITWTIGGRLVIYTQPFKLQMNQAQVKAWASHPGLTDSKHVISEVFTFKAAPCVFDPPAGSFLEEASIQITTTTPRGKCRCTFDGSVPNHESWHTKSPYVVKTTDTMIRCITTHDRFEDSEISSLDSPIIIKANPPVITVRTPRPPGGFFTNEVEFSIQCGQHGQPSDCKLYYTTDGSVPTVSSQLYTGPFAVTMTGTIVKAIKVLDSISPSDAASSDPVSIHAAAPTFSASGTKWGQSSNSIEYFVEKAFISMETSTPNSVIVYTTDGSTPTPSSGTKYEGQPYEDTKYGKETVNAIVFAPGKLESPVAKSLIYDIVVKTGKPVITPNSGGPFTAKVLVTISTPEAMGGEIYFTTDGSLPSPSSQLYTEPFWIDSAGTTVVKAIHSLPGQADSEAGEQSFLVLEQVKPPSFDPDAGVFTDGVTVHIVCGTEGASLRFTTDGTEPNAGSAAYDPSVGVVLGLGQDGKQTIYILKALAMKPPDMGDSVVITSESIIVQPHVEAPVITPNSEGPYKDTLDVSITCATVGSEIYYTIDGEEPTEASRKFSPGVPITITSTQTVVKARGFANKMTPSVVTESVAFILEVSDPTITPDGGEFLNSVQVTLTTSTPGAAIHYTLDSSDPVASSPLYNGPFVIAQTDVVVKTIALHPDLTQSNVLASQDFTVKASAPELDPADGVFTDEALITVTTNTVGAEIRCTLDSTEPTAETTAVESPVDVTGTGSIVRCVATKTGLTVSDVTSMASPIVIKAIPPVMTPDSGSFTNEVSIVMSCASEDCKMHYTTDGSTPTEMSTLYTEPVVVRTTGTVVQAISVADGKTPSDVTSTEAFKVYASAPVFAASGVSWVRGIHDDTEEDFVEVANITMESSTPEAVIVYTSDGTLPSDVAGTVYNGVDEDVHYGRHTIHAITFAEGMLQSPISKSLVYDIVHKTRMPEITPDTGGPFTDHILVTIGCSAAEQGGQCFYTLDGSDPTRASIEYLQPFTIRAFGTTTVKAFMIQTHQADSEVTVASFLVLEQVKTPSFDVSSGTFTDSVTVHLTTATPGAIIRYTTDGSEPNAASDSYNSDTGLALSLPESGEEIEYTIKAVAMKSPDMGDSFVASSGVYVVQPQVAVPVITPDDSAGPFKDQVTVYITCETPGAEIWYTTDGKDPATAGVFQRTLYTDPFVMDNLSPAKNTVRVVATKAHMALSPESVEDYVIKPEACIPEFMDESGFYIEGVGMKVQCPVHHHGIPGKVHYLILPADDDAAEPDETSPIFDGQNITMNEVGNYTIKAIALGDHVLPSEVVQSPYYAILPDPRCYVDEYEPHTGLGLKEIEFDLFDRNCLACPTGGTSPEGSKGILACVAKKGFVGKPGGPFSECPIGKYKDFEGDGDCVACPALSSTEDRATSDVTGCLSLPGNEGPNGGPFQRCPEGTFSREMGTVKCEACPPGGTTRGKIGSSSDADCQALPGWTNEHNWNSGPFVKCKIGWYKSDAGPHPCKSCPFCSTTLQEGSKKMTDCVADIGCEGKGFGWGLGFTKCKTGTFKPTVGNGACPPCPTDGSQDDSDSNSCGGLIPSDKKP